MVSPFLNVDSYCCVIPISFHICIIDITHYRGGTYLEFLYMVEGGGTPVKRIPEGVF